jgi:hypothetical protein
MAWLQSHQSLRDHPKTRKLARRTEMGGLRGAVGLLHCLWWWCLDYAPDGDLTKHDAEDIAIGSEWGGDPSELIKHLTECGFLDADENGLYVHDWTDWAGALIERRERNAARMRSARAAHVQGTCSTRKKERKKERTHAGAREQDVEASRARAQEPSKFPFKEAAAALRAGAAS